MAWIYSGRWFSKCCYLAFSFSFFICYDGKGRAGIRVLAICASISPRMKKRAGRKSGGRGGGR